MIVMFMFLVLKIVNFRIHQSLGSDPLPDPPKEEEEEEEEGEGGEGKDEGKKSAAAAAKEEEAKAELSGGNDCEECVLKMVVAVCVCYGWG